MDISTLRTPERLYANPQAALSDLPSWLIQIDWTHPPEPYPDVMPIGFIWAGKRGRILYEGHTALAIAVMVEITRLPGVSIAVNSNGADDDYLRLTVTGIGEDLTTVSRFLQNATAEEQVRKTEGRKWDMRGETLRKARARKPSKDARTVLIGHIERIAWETERKHKTFDAGAYLANLRRLIILLDLETGGAELSDLIACPAEEA